MTQQQDGHGGHGGQGEQEQQDVVVGPEGQALGTVPVSALQRAGDDTGQGGQPDEVDGERSITDLVE